MDRLFQTHLWIIFWFCGGCTLNVTKLSNKTNRKELGIKNDKKWPSKSIGKLKSKNRKRKQPLAVYFSKGYWQKGREGDWSCFDKLLFIGIENNLHAQSYFGIKGFHQI